LSFSNIIIKKQKSLRDTQAKQIKSKAY